MNSVIQVGFDITSGATSTSEQTVGAEAIIDASVVDTPIFIRNSQPSNGRLAGSLVINNAKLTNVPIAVGVANGAVVLAGGTTTIQSWGQGNIFSSTNGSGRFLQGNIVNANKPSVLLDGNGKIFGKTHPQYAAYAVDQFVSVKDNGARGDGLTDDTAALKAIFNKVNPLILHLNFSNLFLSFRSSSRVVKLYSLMQGHTLSPRHLLSLLELRLSVKPGL